MHSIRLIGNLTLVAFLMLANIGVYVFQYNCNVSLRQDVVVSIIPIDHQKGCPCCTENKDKGSCSFCHNSNEHSPSQPGCSTNERFLVLKTDFLISGVNEIVKPATIQLFHDIIIANEFTELKVQNEFEQFDLTPPKPLWGQNLLKQFHTFKFHIC